MTKPHDPRVALVQKNLRRFRSEAGLTAEQVAHLAGLSIDSLRRYENGGSKVPFEVVTKLAELYGRRADHFTMESPPKPDAAARPAFVLHRVPGTDLSDEDWQQLERVVTKAAGDMRRKTLQLRETRKKT